MNMLLDRVPDHLVISGTRYRIHTSFRTWIAYEKLLTENSEVSVREVFSLVFDGIVPTPKHYDEAVEQILWFYQCGKESQTTGSKSHKEVFSYDYDDGYIVAAFQEQYGIDLNTADLHWWKFRAFMLSLSEDTEFVKIMGYRSVEITSKMSAAQRSFYQKMKKHYRLPMKKADQERINQLEDALLNGESLDGLL